MKLQENYFYIIRDILLTRQDEFGEVYAVGGYVRDQLSGYFSKDLDFSTTKNSIKAARIIADYFRGDFYTLDEKRQTARALIRLDDQQLIVDFALLNGKNIKEDLKKRDFTINAMAVNLLEVDKVIDPLEGQKDLQLRKLKPCSDSSFDDDPIRTMRAVRFIQNLNLDFDQKIKPAIISASKNLHLISAERIRDEICQILGLSDLGRSLKLLTEFNILNLVLPEVKNLEKIPPKSPHIHDGLTHSLRVVEINRFILDCLFNTTVESDNRYLSDIRSLIEKNRKYFNDYSESLNRYKFSIYPLMTLAGLYHDSAKHDIPPVKVERKFSYPNHAETSAEIVFTRMKALSFSNEEIKFVAAIIKYHMSDYLKSIGAEGSKRDIYRFFRMTNDLGVLIGLFHLADLIATYEETLSTERWKTAINSIDMILDGWFNHYDDVVSPGRLITGDDLISEFRIHPGQEIGQILEKIKEEQAAGLISTKKVAIDYAKKMIGEMKIDV